jgi:hypothetical protein
MKLGGQAKGLFALGLLLVILLLLWPLVGVAMMVVLTLVAALWHGVQTRPGSPR